MHCRRVEHLSTLTFLSFLPAVILAAADPNYDPSMNYRPNNVTGLSPFYAWVGSYYNATTEIQLKPEMGSNPNDSLCPSLQGYVATAHFDSVLSITERGPYNSGVDPVNMWLTLIPPNTTLSSLALAPDTLFLRSPLLWPLYSSNPTPETLENSTVQDNFNFTVSKTPMATYNLSATISDPRPDGTSPIANLTMPACNSTEDTDHWTMNIFVTPWWSTIGWASFTVPHVTILFDEKTANLTMTGDFVAYPFVRTNATQWPGQQEIGPGVQGSFVMRFRGILDAYHSDVLETGSSTPTWLRTVGFGNNSQNIGYGVTGSAFSSRSPSMGAVLTTVMISVATMMTLFI